MNRTIRNAVVVLEPDRGGEQNDETRQEHPKAEPEDLGAHGITSRRGLYAASVTRGALSQSRAANGYTAGHGASST